MLINGDCLEKMKDLPDKSIDLVLTDPPYGTTACKWDSVIPFEPMWAELRRIRKLSAAIVLFGSEPFSSALRISNIKEFKYDWVWEKEQGVNWLNCKNQPLKIHELVSVFGTRINYYPVGLTLCNKIKKPKNGLMPFNNINKPHEQKYSNYPKSITKHNRERGLHPTQKPVPLLEYLIKTYTHEGDTVLDFAMGSGSTGVACRNTNRKFVGIELDADYFEIAKKRIHGSADKPS